MQICSWVGIIVTNRKVNSFYLTDGLNWIAIKQFSKGVYIVKFGAISKEIVIK